MFRMYFPFFLLAFLLSCGTAFAAATPLPVIVSIAPQKYMLERIAGSNISVNVLVKPGADPHSYEPSPSQMRQCADAKVWFSIGIPFEDVWLERIRGAAPDLAVVSSIKGIARLPYAQEHDHQDGHAEHAHDHGEEDPHVWLSPMLVREMLPGLARELGKLMPDRAAEFRKQAREFGNELEQLDQELADRFDKVPVEKRVFLTFHPSWRYFAHNYQLRELSIERDGKEPGPKSIKTFIDTARQLGIRAVFLEPQFAKNAAKAVADSLGARVVEADPLAEDLPALYRDMADKLLSAFPE